MAVLATLIVVSLLLIAAGLFPQEWLRALVEGQIRETLGPGSQIGRLHVVPGRLRAVVNDVTIEGPGYRFEVPRMRIALALPTLFGKAIALRSVELQRPVLTIQPAPTPAAEKKDATAGLQKSILVGNIRVTDGTIIYHDPTLGDLRVPDVDIQGGVGKSSLQLQTGAPRWQGERSITFEPVRATASISPLLEASIESLELGTKRSRLTASGDLGDLADPVLALDVQFRIDLADAALVSPDAGPMTGMVSGTAKLTGPAESVQANAQIDGRELRITGQTIDQVKAELMYKDTRTQSTFTVLAWGGRITGSVEKNDTRVDASARATDVDLTRLLAAYAPGVSGRGQLEASARGTLGERIDMSMSVDASGRSKAALAFTAKAGATGAIVGPRYEADLDWTASGTAEQPPDPTGVPTLKTLAWNAEGQANGAWPFGVTGRIEGNGRMLSPTHESPFRVEGRVARQAETTSAALHLSGELGLATVDAQMSASRVAVDVNATDMRLERFLPETFGVARFSFKGSGPPGRFQGEGRGQVAQLIWRDVAIGEVNLQAEAEDGTNRATIRAPALAAEANVTVAPTAPRSSDLALKARIELRNSPLAPFAPLLEPTLEGRATATIDVEGPVATLATAARVQARVQSLDIATERAKVALQEPLEIEATPSRVILRNLHAAGDGFDIRGAGTIGVAATAPIDAQLQGTLALARLPLPNTRAEGTVRLDVRLSGTRERPLAHGGVDFEGVTATVPGAPEIRAESARIVMAGERIQIPDATITVAGGRVRMNGELPVAALLPPPAGSAPRDTHGRLDVIWQGVDAAQLHAAAAPDSEMAVTGVLEGDAHFEGSFTSLQGATGALRMPPLALTVGEMGVNVSGVTLEIRNGRAILAPVDIGTGSQQGALHIQGSADLVRRTVDGSVTGAVDLRVLSPFMQNASMSGRAELNIDVGGSLDAPQPNGRLALTDVTVRMRDIQPPLTEINGVVELGAESLRIAQVTALWGGGPVKMSGSAALKDGALRDTNVTITGDNMALRYLDVKVLVGAEVKITGRTGALQVGGRVDLKNGLYDKDIFFDESLRAPAVQATAASPLLSTIALSLQVVTSQPFKVQNNIARLQARGNLTIRGTAEAPAPFGRFTILDGGKVKLQQREFTIFQRGQLQYVGDLNPELDIVAQAPIPYRDRVGSSTSGDFTVKASGRLEAPVLEFSENDIPTDPARAISIIATGREDPGEGSQWVVGEQAAALLAGRLSATLSRQLQRLGLDQVTIEPNLIAQESDPSARLTFGKNLTDWSSVIYSIGLQDTNEPFAQLNINPLGDRRTNLFRDLGFHVRRTDDARTIAGLRHSFRVGGRRRQSTTTPAADSMTVQEIRIEGALPVDESVVQQWIDTSPGSKRTFWDLQDDADRIRTRLANQGYIEASATARLDGEVAVFAVRAGPHVTWRVEGMPSPPDLTDAVRSAFYIEEAIAKGEQRLLEALRGQGHLRATAATEVEGEGNERTLVFRVTPGLQYQGADVVFEGASALSHKDLLRVAGGPGELVTQSARARRRIQDRYRELYYLSATVAAPIVEDVGSRIAVRVPVREGPQARIARITFTGHSLDEDQLRWLTVDLMGIVPDLVATEEALQRIRERYLESGFPYIRVSSRLTPRAPDVELNVAIDEGPQVRIREIVFEGGARVPLSVIRRELPFREGDPLDPRKLTRSESRLAKYDVRARISSEPEDPGRVVVRLSPAPRLNADYTIEVDDQSTPGGTLNVRAPNLLPLGLTPGFGFHQNEWARTVRGYVRLPALLHSGVLNLSVAQEYEDVNADTGRQPRNELEEQKLLKQESFTATVLQELELADRWRLQYGYSFRRTKITTPVFALPVEADRGRLETALIRDTRDHLFDAHRGRFWSISLSYAPKTLGTDAPFAKGLGQLMVYRPLTRQLTWAHAYRLGAGGTPGGGRLVAIERFEAGGARSLRGYALREVGPYNPITNRVEAGDSVAIINQELRYRHRSGFGGVVFYDLGNVFARVQDIGFDLRHSIGAGLRYDSPIGPLRIDFGIPINRLRNERAYQVHFGIGQAF